MELLYTIFVLPIEFIYGFIYFVCVKLTNNYGIGLFVLSCISAIAFLPIAKLAESQQNAENEDRSILAPQLALIKEKYSGKERNDAINRLYNRYSYHPIKSIRSAFGVLLQLPFLAGAYYMISSLEDIKGQSFLCISDLSQPDGLLFGLNLLPILMTLINIGVIFTTKGLQKKDILQALVIALFFLLFLYMAPSALLIFWTMNNVFFLLKNFTKKTLSKNNKQYSFKFFSRLFPSISPQEATLHTKIYFASLLSLSFIVFFYNPLNLYVSDQSYFTVSITGLIYDLLPFACSAVLYIVFAWIIFSGCQSRKLLSYAALFLFIFTLVNMFVIVEYYGVLDCGTLSKSNILLKNSSLFNELGKNILIALVFTVILLNSKLIFFSSRIVTILTIPLILLCLYNALLKNQNRNDNIEISKNKNYVEVQSYSKDGKNVIIILLDMFTGGHIQKMISDPWFDNFLVDLDGFTWYPDTLSPGSCTILGVPAIYGGPKYDPLQINERANSLEDEIHNALAVLPRNFSNNGYITHFIGAHHPLNMDLLEAYGAVNQDIFYVDNIEYENKIREVFPSSKPVYKNNALFTLAVSLFTISPKKIKRIIYSHYWLGTIGEVSLSQIKQVENLYSFLNFNIEDNSPKDTLKLFYSRVTHFPWHLDRDNLVFIEDPYPQTQGLRTLVNDISPEHYYTERHVMKMIMQYISILKQNDIYNNTKIILVSDHCTADSQMLANIFAEREAIVEFGSEQHLTRPLGRPHALLMVKDFNKHGPMEVSNSLMSISDVPTIAASHLESFDEFPLYVPYLRTKEDTRIHAIPFSWNIDDQKNDQFILEKYWEIKGSMFIYDNWKEINMKH